MKHERALLGLGGLPVVARVVGLGRRPGLGLFHPESPGQRLHRREGRRGELAVHAVDDEAVDVVREDDALEDVREGFDGQLAILVNELLGSLGLSRGFSLFARRRRLSLRRGRLSFGFLVTLFGGGRVDSLGIVGILLVLVVGVVLEDPGQPELRSHPEPEVANRLGGGSDALVDVQLGHPVLGRQLQRRLRRERVRRTRDEDARGVVGGDVEVQLGSLGFGLVGVFVLCRRLGLGLGLGSRLPSFFALGFRDGVTILVEFGLGVLGVLGGGGGFFFSLSRRIRLDQFGPLLLRRESSNPRRQEEHGRLLQPRGVADYLLVHKVLRVEVLQVDAHVNLGVVDEPHRLLGELFGLSENLGLFHGVSVLVHLGLTGFLGGRVGLGLLFPVIFAPGHHGSAVERRTRVASHQQLVRLAHGGDHRHDRVVLNHDARLLAEPTLRDLAVGHVPHLNILALAGLQRAAARREREDVRRLLGFAVSLDSRWRLLHRPVARHAPVVVKLNVRPLTVANLHVAKVQSLHVGAQPGHLHDRLDRDERLGAARDVERKGELHRALLDVFHGGVQRERDLRRLAVRLTAELGHVLRVHAEPPFLQVLLIEREHHVAVAEVLNRETLGQRGALDDVAKVHHVSSDGDGFYRLRSAAARAPARGAGHRGAAGGPRGDQTRAASTRDGRPRPRAQRRVQHASLRKRRLLRVKLGRERLLPRDVPVKRGESPVGGGWGRARRGHGFELRAREREALSPAFLAFPLALQQLGHHPEPVRLVPNLSPRGDVLFLLAALLARAEQAHVVNLLVLDGGHGTHHRNQVGFFLVILLVRLGFHPDLSEPARPGRVEGSLAEEAAATGGRGLPLAERQLSPRAGLLQGSSDDRAGNLTQGETLGVLGDESLEHRVGLGHAVAAHRRQVRVGIPASQQQYPRLLDVHRVLIGHRPGQRHRHAAVDALAGDGYPDRFEVRNLQGDALVDLVRDAGPDGEVYVARVVAANLALLGRHRQQRLSRKRLGVDPERNLNAAGVGQHDLFVDRLVERLPAKVDGRGVQFVLDEVRIRRQFDVVRGSTLDFAHGHRANLRVRLGKVRDLHAFLFARLEVAADGEDVEDLLGIRIFERRVGIALGPASFYPLRLVESLVHHLLDHRRLILVDVRVVVRLEHPLEPRGDRSCVSHRDVLTLCGVVEDAAKVDERVAEVEVGERKLRAEVDGIDVRIIVVAHQ